MYHFRQAAWTLFYIRVTCLYSGVPAITNEDKENEKWQSKLRPCHFPYHPPRGFWNHVITSQCMTLEWKVVLLFPGRDIIKSGKPNVWGFPKYKGTTYIWYIWYMNNIYHMDAGFLQLWFFETRTWLPAIRTTAHRLHLVLHLCSQPGLV